MNEWLSYLLIGGPVVAVILIGVFEAGGWLRQLEHIKLYGHPAPDVKITTVAIQPKSVVGLFSRVKRFFKGAKMGTVVEGQTDALMVVATNAAGRVILPLPNASIALSQASDTVGTVDPATGNFTFTAGAVAGDDSLVATVSGVASQPYVETVVQDNTIAAVVIQPQPAAAPAAPA